jgi:hypothetical protein
MKVLAVMLLSITLRGVHPAPPRPTRADPEKTQHARKGGQWYFAENGHAVYCYGPVMHIQDLQAGLQRVATFCQGDRPMVLLKD